MRKIILIVILLAAAGAGGHYYVWKQQAAKVQALVDADIQVINQTFGASVLTYESMKVHGWPISVNITLAKPVMNIPVSGMISVYPSSQPSIIRRQPIPDVLHWTERMEIPQGSIEVLSNPSASHLTLKINGDQIFSTLLDGKEESRRVIHYDSPPSCTVDLTQGLVSGPLDRAGLLGQLRSVSCDSAALRMQNTSGALLASLDKMSLFVNSEQPVKGMRRLDLSLHLNNAKSTALMDAQGDRYAALLTRAQGLPDAPPFPRIPASAYGAQNFDLDVHYNGPDNPAMLAMRPDMSLDIDHFALQNDLVAAGLSLQLHDSKAEGTQRHTTFVMDAAAKFSPRFDELKLQQLQQIATLASTRDDVLPPSMKAALQDWKPEEISGALIALYPKLSDLGDMAAHIDMTLDADPMLQNGTLKIAHLDQKTSAYGLAVNGEATMKQHMLGSGQLVIVCTNCEAMINRLGTYAAVTNAYALRLYPQTIKPYVTPKLTSAIHGFLSSIAKTADVKPAGITANDWVYHLSLAEGSPPMLNTRPLQQVFIEFMTEVAPYLPQTNAEPGANKNNNAPPSRYEPAPAQAPTAPLSAAPTPGRTATP